MRAVTVSHVGAGSARCGYVSPITDLRCVDTTGEFHTHAFNFGEDPTTMTKPTDTEAPAKKTRTRKPLTTTPLALAEHVYQTQLAWSDAEVSQFERVLAALKATP